MITTTLTTTIMKPTMLIKTAARLARLTTLATLVTIMALVPLLTACCDDDPTAATTTPTALAIDPGDKPAYTATNANANNANTRTSLITGQWQVGDCVEVTLQFIDYKDNELSTQKQTLTRTANAKWIATPAIILVPTGAAKVKPTYTYASSPDPRTGTVERIIGKLAQSSSTTVVSSEGIATLPTSGNFTLPAPAWTRRTALVVVHSIMPNVTAQIALTNAATSGTEWDGSTSGKEWKNTTGSYATANFHLPAAATTNATDASFALKVNQNDVYTAATYQAGNRLNISASTDAGTGDDESAQTVFINSATATVEEMTKMFNDPIADQFIISETELGKVKTALQALEKVNSSKKVKLLMPDVDRVGSGAFQYCHSLAGIELPKATIIEYNGFYGCSALTTISIPKVNDLGNDSFGGCHALTRMVLTKSGGEIKVHDRAFNFNTSNLTLVLHSDAQNTNNAMKIKVEDIENSTMKNVTFKATNNGFPFSITVKAVEYVN